MMIRSRNQFGALLASRGLCGEAAEIGVAEGGFSFNLLATWSGHLHMIDCWSNQDQSEYRDSFNTGDAAQLARYEMVLKRADAFVGRGHVHRMFSKDAAPTFFAGQLDFVYIDANHRYEAIKEDISLWWPKVKTFGILAGHDYLNGNLPTGDYGVKRAVDEFAATLSLPVAVIPEEWPSWWIVKP